MTRELYHGRQESERQREEKEETSHKKRQAKTEPHFFDNREEIGAFPILLLDAIIEIVEGRSVELTEGVALRLWWMDTRQLM